MLQWSMEWMLGRVAPEAAHLQETMEETLAREVRQVRVGWATW